MKTGFKTVTFLLASLALFACKDKADIYANPPANLVEQIDAYYPLSIKYVKKHEQIALSQGVPLRPQYLKIARDIGIQNPEKIRVLYVDKMPLPENDVHLKTYADDITLTTSNTHVNKLKDQMDSYREKVNIWLKGRILKLSAER